MANTKKLFAGLSLIMLMALPLISSAQATSVNIQSVSVVVNLLRGALGILRAIFFVLAAIFVVLAAFKYLTAQGDATKVGEAKQMLIYTIVAIALALIANSLQAVVVNYLQTYQ